MKPKCILRCSCLLLLAAGLAVGTSTRAEGPLTVGGPPSTTIPNSVSGQPFTWASNSAAFDSSTKTLSYWTDLGNLGSLTNTGTDDLVDAAFKTWQDVPTAVINFTKAGKLSQDVISTNAPSVFNALNDCSNLPNAPAGGIAQPVTIVYDTDGRIFTDFFNADANKVIGAADAICFTSDGVNNSFNRGEAILNGKVLSSGDVTVLGMQAAMTHEFGHMIGLDHSQINLNCLTDKPCSADDLAGLPLMFPVQLTDDTSVKRDDIAGASMLYPETVDNSPTQVPFASSTGRITGRVFFSDGMTQAQGFNVIARQVTVAVSNVSGFLFTPDAGNAVVPGTGTEFPFGSRDQTKIGLFDIPGLPPGDYTLEVEGIHNSDPVPFVGGSSVGPIGNLNFQFVLPGTCSGKQFFNSPPPGTDPCTIWTSITVLAGDVKADNDIILIGTPPRFDAWEDGP